MSQHLEIKQASVADFKLVFDWVQQEGWSTSSLDRESYFAVDQQGFFILYLNNKPIGAISVVQYSKDLAFLGFFVVLEQYRQHGYGTKLFEFALDKIVNTPNVGLYAIVKQIPRYQKYGFFEEAMNTHWVLKENSFSQKAPTNSRLQLCDSHESLLKLIEKDASNWGASREGFFTTELRCSNARAYTLIDEEQVCGYGLIRQTDQGYRIGPLYADDVDGAIAITEALLSHADADGPVIFDIPSSNHKRQQFAKYFGLQQQPAADTCIMYRPKNHQSNNHLCYGVASLEIG